MWTEELFGVKKPIIALLHVQALPGDPLYEGDLEDVVTRARHDLLALQEGGVDGILIANEFSFPHQPNCEYVTVAAMGYVIGRIKDEIKVPFGVNIAYNSIATLDLAAAVGADFVRNAFTGAYMGEGGLISMDPATALRRKKALGLDSLKMLYKVNPESEAYLVPRDIKSVTKSIIFSCMADGLCVSGENAGFETDTDVLAAVKEVSGDVPVFCNTGFNAETAAEKLAYCDSACVGTAFKKDGKFENDVDVERVKELMNVVKEIRRTL